VNVNLGCGRDVRVGWLNVDKVYRNNVFLHDIDLAPLPDTHDYVWAGNVLEHLSVDGIVNIHRSLKGGRILEGEVPHYLSRHAYNDFTHKHYFNEQTFRQFPFDLFKLEKVETWYCFGKLLRFTLPQWFVCLHERLLPGVCPPSHIHFRLRKSI
jgi:SAM-dependent methyltransferase